jgi:hypothetical protein
MATTLDDAPRRRPLQRAATIASAVVGAAVLGGVFVLYTRPAFMVSMIDQLWACF